MKEYGEKENREDKRVTGWEITRWWEENKRVGKGEEGMRRRVQKEREQEGVRERMTVR